MEQNTRRPGRGPYKPPSCSWCDDGGAVMCDGKDPTTGLAVVYAYQCNCPNGPVKHPALPPLRIM